MDRLALEVLEDRCLLSATLVRDIYPGSPNAFNFPSKLTALSATVFFQANNGVHGYELWKSDGTTAGTVLVKDINPGSAISDPARLTNVNATLFFTANDGVHGHELWKSDGTTAGTVLVKDIRPGAANSMNVADRAYFTAVNTTLFFAATGDAATNVELWKSDGTEAGTVRVKDINPGSAGSRPRHLTNVNGTLFFIAADASGRLDLWKSDGTEAGTVVIKTDVTFGQQLAPVNVNGTLFFAAPVSGGGTGLWKTDGTVGGTVQVKDIAPTGPGSGYPWMINVSGVLYFSANASGTGTELWKSDGTEAGTVLVKDIWSGASSSQPKYLTNVNGALFFAASTPGAGDELYKSDGTAAGTVLVKDIFAGATGSGPLTLVDVSGTVYFAARTAAQGLELWKSNGTEAGTVLVQDFYPGSTWGLQTTHESLTNANGALFLAADDGMNGAELWTVPPAAGVNRPPVLGAIANQTVNEASLLSFTVTATDPDMSQSRTFSLVSPPAGASIHPSSGAFTWTPPDGPATTLLTVRVTDDGTPALSDTRHFTVTVLNVAPAAGVSGPSSGTPGQALTFTFTAADPSAVDQAPGFTYVINWGDGSPLQTIDAFPGSGSGVPVSHAYAAAGAYVVQVNATDKDGGTGSAMLSPPVMIASGPGVSDLSWSGGGILAPPSVPVGQSFTIARTFAVGGEPVGPFAIAYWASVDDIFGNEDDFLVGTESFAGAAPGIHSGVSPSFMIGAPGTYRLFAVLDSAGQIDEIDEDNNLVMALATLLVT